MPAEPTIDYDALAQDAMRGVVRTVLLKAATSGLPGDHHFYISFDTSGTGVVLSKRLKEKYPNEMTVVLQHRFWDLAVHDDRFEVKLTFDGIPERLVIPFDAIKVFFDPSVRYGLQFENIELEPETGEPSAQRFGHGSRSDLTNGAPTQLRPAPKKPRAPRKLKAEKTEKSDKPETTDKPEKTDKDKATASENATSEIRKAPARSKPEPVDEDRPTQDNGGAEIVSLDAFRKK